MICCVCGRWYSREDDVYCCDPSQGASLERVRGNTGETDAKSVATSPEPSDNKVREKSEP